MNKARAELRAFFSWAGTTPNPVGLVRRDKEAAPPIRFMPWETFEAFADYFWRRRPALALFVELLGETGARWSEIQRAHSSAVRARDS